MKQTTFTKRERDYSGVFLGAILLGIIIVVFALAMTRT
jgi:hypothetical protein